MSDKSVSFARCKKKSAFMDMQSHDSDTIYFIQDTKQIYLGDVEYIPEGLVNKDYVDSCIPQWKPISEN